MDTNQLLPVLWRRRWSFLVTFLLVLGAVVYVTFQLPKVYVTSSYLLVSPRQPPTTSFEATQVSETLTRTFGELLQTPRTAERVQRNLGPDVADGDVGSQVSVEYGDSQLIEITAEGDSPREAQLIVNTWASTFANDVDSFANLAPTSGVVTVAQSATIPETPSRPRPKLYLLIGAALATLAGAGMALLRQRLDQRLEIDGSDTEVLGLPILGRIPQSKRGINWGVDSSKSDRESAHTAEAFRLLLVNMSFASLDGRAESIAVVSASEREGKSACVLSLGRAAAETGLKTLVVDGDLRRPTLEAKVGLSGSTVGLSNLLVDSKHTLHDAGIQLPAVPLQLLPSGPVPPNPAALLGGRRLKDFDTRARGLYDFIVYDTPPLSIAADASLMATHADGVLLVINVRATRRKAAVKAIDQLRRANVNLLGVILNRVSGEPSSSYYYADGQHPPPVDTEQSLAPSSG